MTSSDCVFCSIIAGTSPAHVVLDDTRAVAFLDIVPLFPGHTLVVPRRHHVTISDLPSSEIAPFFAAVQEVVRGVEAAMDSPGSFVAMNNIVSQSVPHLHVHVVPRRPKDGLRGFFWPRTRYDDEVHAATVADAIRAALLADD